MVAVDVAIRGKIEIGTITIPTVIGVKILARVRPKNEYDKREH